LFYDATLARARVGGTYIIRWGGPRIKRFRSSRHFTLPGCRFETVLGHIQMAGVCDIYSAYTHTILIRFKKKCVVLFE